MNGWTVENTVMYDKGT